MLSRKRRHHAEKRDDKERVVELLMQGDAGAREVARDLLLERGIIKTGRVVSVRPIDSFAGPVVFQIDVATGTGARLGENDPKRFWMMGAALVPTVGDVIDYTETREYPPTGKSAFAPRWHLHPTGILRAEQLPESVIRRWVEKWWIE